VSYARLIRDISNAVNPAAAGPAGVSVDSLQVSGSLSFTATETAPVKQGSNKMNPVTSDTLHGNTQNLFCPLITVVEVDTPEFYVAGSQLVQMFLNTFAEAQNPADYLFSIAIINMFEMLSVASQDTAGLGSSIITDREVVLNCFEAFFKAIQSMCRQGMISVILSMDLASECMWNDSLTTKASRISYIQMIISNLSECLNSDHCLQHVKMISCKRPASGSKSSLFTQGSFEVPVLMFSTTPNTPEASFFNHRVSVQKYPIAPLNTTFEKQQFIPTVFTPLLQPHVLEKTNDRAELIIHAPTIPQVLYRYETAIDKCVTGIRMWNHNYTSSKVNSFTDSCIQR
jgi:hypothetical protein